MSSNDERMDSEESSSPSPPHPPPSSSSSVASPSPPKEENSPSFKLSIKRGKTETGAVILTSKIIDSSAENHKTEQEEEDEEAANGGEGSVLKPSSTTASTISTQDDASILPKTETAVDDVEMESGDVNDDAGTAVLDNSAAAADSAVSGVSSEPLWMVGDVVWCLQRGNPWWPCLVTNEFKSDEHSRYTNSGSRTIKQYHVQFFGPKPLHAWIHENSVRPFADRNEVAGWKERDVAVFKKMSKPRREKAMKAYTPTSKAIIMELDAAKDEADKALAMPIMERLDVFEFDYQSVGENSTEMTTDRRKVKYTPLKPGTTVVMMSAEGGGRIQPPEIKSEPSTPSASTTFTTNASSSSTATAPVSAAAAPLSTTTRSSDSPPPSKRRRTIAPTYNENGLSSSFLALNNINNNNTKLENNNLTTTVEGDSVVKPAPIKYSMTPLGSGSGGGSLVRPAAGKSEPPLSVSSSLTPGRVKEEKWDVSDGDARGDNGDLRRGENGDVDDGNDSEDEMEEDASPKDNPDIFSKFSQCHAAEIKSHHPELSAESIETKLREQWNSMTDEEANWYIYNGVPPGKLLPGKKRMRPKSKFLEKLFEQHDRRRKNGLTA